jgi:hypothetical protein
MIDDLDCYEPENAARMLAAYRASEDLLKQAEDEIAKVKPDPDVAFSLILAAGYPTLAVEIKCDLEGRAFDARQQLELARLRAEVASLAARESRIVDE